MANEIKATEEYLQFLDNLRKSGITNMFGGAAYLSQQFPELSKATARQILMEWMETFGDRHKSDGE